MIFVMLAGLLLSSGAFSYITLFVEASIKIADGQVSKIPPVVSSAQEGCGKPNVVTKIIRHKKAIQIRFFTVLLPAAQQSSSPAGGAFRRGCCLFMV